MNTVTLFTDYSSLCSDRISVTEEEDLDPGLDSVRRIQYIGDQYLTPVQLSELNSSISMSVNIRM